MTTEQAREDFEIALADYVYDVAHNYRLCIADSRRKLNTALDALIQAGSVSVVDAERAESTRRSESAEEITRAESGR